MKIPFRWLSLIAFVVGLDQGTKTLAEQYLNPMLPLRVLDFFDLVLAHNNGAAFSFLRNAGGWQRYFLIFISIAVTAVLIQWLWELESKQMLLSAGLALIIGGAVGNLIDRVATGEVIDFLSFHYAGWYFPAFNIADSAITIGIALLLIDTVLLHTAQNEQTNKL